MADRGHRYGPAEACFDRIVKLFKLTTGKDLSMYEVAMLLHCVKLARMPENPGYDDNYVDGINYLAFAGQFAELGQTDTSSQDLENDITAEVAKRYAPKKVLKTTDFDPVSMSKMELTDDTQAEAST